MYLWSSQKKNPISEQIKDRFSKPFLMWEINPQRKWVLLALIMVFSIAFKLIYLPFGISPDKGILFFIHHAFVTTAILRQVHKNKPPYENTKTNTSFFTCSHKFIISNPRATKKLCRAL